MVLSHSYCCGPCLVFFRKLYMYSVLRTNHYKTLGLSPSATQSEIKSAYYELSKKHHPDRNQGSEKSAKMFRDITAAYEILGNETLRKKYDESRPYSAHNDSNSFETAPRGDYNDYVEKMYYERRQRRFRRRYYYGKTPYFDFDTWYRAHYGKDSNYDSHTWVKGPFGKVSYDHFEEWYRSQYEKSKKFKQREAPSYTYKQSMEAMKKQDSFIRKAENAIIAVFYLSLIAALLCRL